MKSSMSASSSSNKSSDVSFGSNENGSSVTVYSLENSSHATPLTASLPTNIFSETQTTTNIGSIALQQCNQVTFGNQNFYQGPITIVCDNRNLKTETDDNSNGSNDRVACARILW